MSVPALNALLNATSAVCVLAGLWCIRAQHRTAHIVCMLAAVIVSAGFLVSYVAYHLEVGSVAFRGTGWIRPVYFTILLTHTVLAVVILPLIARTVFLAVRRRYDAHGAIARWTAPLWLYVSVTGVVVYWMVYRSPWAAA